MVEKTADMRYNKLLLFWCVRRAALLCLRWKRQQRGYLTNDSRAEIVSCRESDETVGCARVFWDKGYIAYLADVIVMPAYQGHGIGKALVSECIKFIDRQLKQGWRIKIVIVSAKGKEQFYEKLGFQIRPNDKDDAGMDMWRQLV